MYHHAARLRSLLAEPRLAEFFGAVWDEVLVPICGAYNGAGEKDNFVDNHMDTEFPVREWRFQGSLGFGGKFRIPLALRCSVECYPEDETPARKKTIEMANSALTALVARFTAPVVAEV